MDARIEIHQDGAWRPAAVLQSFGIDRCRVEYLPEYVFGDAPFPIALNLPVGFAPERAGPDGSVDRSVPAFLYDLVPQGRGRRHLVSLLKLQEQDPLAETIEFLKRDVLNLALRNTDNHARNSAVQRLPNGRIQLTPVFDFAPMFLDPDMVPRSIHWRDGSGRRLDRWADVIDALALPEAERNSVARSLREFAGMVERLPDMARDCGVEDAVLEPCRRSIEAQARDLGALPVAEAVAPPADRAPAGPAVKRKRGQRRG
ncbi:HipA domain-containing protein [Azohydromonas aeria]|uniref:HipA domain-containing protein n=1 Tax=Azohydromonas aeria TaxID=2590212 RepID=UPI001E5FB62A|nr:HipA domain-containing protein [Azohydromonas aeria]